MLRAKFARGFFWLSVGTAAQQLISFLVFIYLTRALDPTQFGIVALAVVFVEILIIVSHFGQMEIVQQRPAPIEKTASTAFWLIQALGLTSTIGLILAAPGIAALAGNPDLALYIIILSPAVLITTLGHIHEGLLRREMSYRPLAIRTIAATAVSAVTAAGAIILGWHDYALVAQKLSYVSVMTAVLWIAYPWRPQFLVSLSTLRGMVRQGFHIMCANLSTQLDMRILDFVVGVYLGTYWLGQLKIAWRIFEFVAQVSIVPVSNIALRLFAQSNETPERLRATFLETAKVLALAACPVFFGLAAIAPDITLLVLGEKWLDAAPMIQLLGILSLAAIVNYLFAPLLISVGRTGHVLAQGLLQNTATALLAFLSVGFGAYAVMIAHIVRAYFIGGANLIAIGHTTSIRPRAVIGAIAPAATCAIAMAAIVIAARPALASALPDLMSLGAQVLIGAIAYGALIALGDLASLWPGYLRGLVRHARDILRGSSETVIPKGAAK